MRATHQEQVVTAAAPVELLAGDCLQVMQGLEAESVHAVVTDPPYGLAFMGKEWDDFRATRIAQSQVVKNLGVGMRMTTAAENRNFQEWTSAWAAECLRILKPGGWLLSFGGSRTYHRLAAGIEDAGFEVRDQLLWLYATGYPKSLNLKGDWAGWGTALKPAHEPLVLARKPPIGTIAANVQQHGTGAMNIDGCRVPLADGEDISVDRSTDRRQLDTREQGWGFRAVSRDNAGRWPANLLHDGSPEVIEALGPAARYFYCPKASKAEKDAGCDDLPITRPDTRTSSGMGTFEEKGVLPGRNPHPTVKPLALMRYLTRLVTPPGGLVLDPFAGSGTTLIAAGLEGFSAIGIEREANYRTIAERRIAHHLGRGE